MDAQMKKESEFNLLFNSKPYTYTYTIKYKSWLTKLSEVGLSILNVETIFCRLS